MAEDTATRTEEPTPKRLEDALAEGKVPRSVEVTSAAVLLAALMSMSYAGEGTIASIREMMRRSLRAVSATDLTAAQTQELIRRTITEGFIAVAPLLAATAVVGIAVAVAQVGFHVHLKQIIPDAEKVSPAAAWKRIFSSRGLVELLKSVAKIILVAWVGWKVLWASQDRIPPLALSQPHEILRSAGVELRRLMIWVVGVASVLAALDYAWQRRQHYQGLRMTRTEVKDERRQAEGDPQVRQRVKHAYQRLAKSRMLADVPSATVVITNPVRLAVALAYQPGEMSAPRVVAKGAEQVAERIKDIARKHGIPIVERRALAQALFRTVPVGGEIPAALYRAVAEILAYIYGLQKRKAG